MNQISFMRKFELVSLRAKFEGIGNETIEHKKPDIHEAPLDFEFLCMSVGWIQSLVWFLGGHPGTDRAGAVSRRSSARAQILASLGTNCVWI